MSHLSRSMSVSASAFQTHCPALPSRLQVRRICESVAAMQLATMPSADMSTLITKSAQVNMYASTQMHWYVISHLATSHWSASGDHDISSTCNTATGSLQCVCRIFLSDVVMMLHDDCSVACHCYRNFPEARRAQQAGADALFVRADFVDANAHADDGSGTQQVWSEDLGVDKAEFVLQELLDMLNETTF